ncbi:MAG: zf-HC2 domain-containing protein [Ktedonobacterales bacterium]|nr:zf-HC2 domain-containing protein [Ktedonobacterales bacterium]
MMPSRDCARCRALLPEYVAGRLSQEDNTFVTAHLATCAECTQELAQWQSVASAIRASEPGAVPSLTLTVARVQLRDRIAALPVLNHQGGPMIIPDDAPLLTATPPVRLPPPAYRRTFPIAAAILVITLAGTLIFALTQARRTIPGTTTPPPCPTGTPISTNLGTYDSIEVVSMLNAHEGWGAGSTWGPKITDGPHALLAHFDGCRWQVADRSIPNVVLTNISMTSATDGWAVGLSYKVNDKTFLPTGQGILHYHAGKWNAVTVPEFTAPYGAVTPQVQMVSSTEGWLIGGTIAGQHVQSLLFHYQNGSWSKVTTGLAPDVLLSGLTTTSSGEAWAITQKINQVDQNGKLLSTAPEGIGHYQHGTWTTFDLPALATLHSLSMLTPTNGFAIGEIGEAGSQQLYQLHYDGTSWQRITAPIVGTPTHFVVFGFSMVSGNDGWATINTATESGTKGSIIHYHDGQWTKDVTPADVMDFRTIQMISPTDGWAIGGANVNILGANGQVVIVLDKGRLYHYTGGVWSAITASK